MKIFLLLISFNLRFLASLSPDAKENEGQKGV